MPTMTPVRLDPELAAEALRWLPDALAGDERAARRYARAWRGLVRALCADHPDAPPSAADVLDHLAVTAPFHHDGPLRALVSAAAGIIPRLRVVKAPRAVRFAPPPSADYARFARSVLAEVEDGGSGLRRLMEGWQLTITDVARLFGVTRQAVQQWLDDGVPSARRSKLLAVLEIADLLERNLLAERIPGVVRAPADSYAGLSLLEAIGLDRHQAVLEDVQRSFDWAWST